VRACGGGRRAADGEVLAASVHTARGQEADWRRDAAGRHVDQNWHGWGSDHFPVSADLLLAVRR